MEISEYANKNAISITDVWQRVRKGQLMAKTKGLEFHVFESGPAPFAEAAPTNEPLRAGASISSSPLSATIAKEPVVFGGLKVSPSVVEAEKSEESFDDRDIQDSHNDEEDSLEALPPSIPAPQERQGAQSTEIALLLDHLSLAKEENRDILRLTQDSISRITQMAETMMSMKDEILRQREDELGRLRKSVEDQGRAVNRLKQELEDLHILNRTLGDNA